MCPYWPSVSKYNDHRDVVRATPGICRNHQFASRRTGIVMAAQNLADRAVIHVRGQPVAAQQQAVAAFEPDREPLGAGRTALARAKRARDHILVFVMARFLGRDLTDFNQPLHERMVPRKLTQPRSEE